MSVDCRIRSLIGHLFDRRQIRALSTSRQHWPRGKWLDRPLPLNEALPETKRVFLELAVSPFLFIFRHLLLYTVQNIELAVDIIFELFVAGMVTKSSVSWTKSELHVFISSHCESPLSHWVVQWCILPLNDLFDLTFKCSFVEPLWKHRSNRVVMGEIAWYENLANGFISGKFDWLYVCKEDATVLLD